ncbi:hypothetical protein [Yinghuangia seranimata]|uniref:hypothetical protein n=1 Tax=Yinghuangia seranimata TaxID=408067 RepID=UPI00248B8956|nr:hypothetical protein [Yinghuangia seranimata]MDI2127958.1 hypothetical protein [Yinghuangia seranimata]
MRVDRVSWALAWLALLAAVVLTAAGEYALYAGCGFGRWVSAAGPVCLDAYAVAAIRARREVLPAVLVMIGANATAHLLPPGGPPVGVVVAVSSLAPLVLWRTHVLLDDGRAHGSPQSGDPHLEVVVDDVRGTDAIPLEVAAAAGDHLRGAAKMVGADDVGSTDPVAAGAETFDIVTDSADEPSSWEEPWRAPWDDRADDHLDDQMTDPTHSAPADRPHAPAVVAGWSSAPVRDDRLDDQAHDHPETSRDPGEMVAPVVDQPLVFPAAGSVTRADATTVQATTDASRNRAHIATVTEGSGVVPTLTAEGAQTARIPDLDAVEAIGQQVLSDTELRRAARKLQRDALQTTRRPVTVDALRTTLGVSRRRAVELRREVVGAGR